MVVQPCRSGAGTQESGEGVMSDREELIKAVSIVLRMAIDMTDEDVARIEDCDCVICDTLCGALAIYEGLKEAERLSAAKKCLH